MGNGDAPYLVDPLGRAIPLATPVTLLGRGAECDVVIADRRASRRHAEIVCEDEPAAPVAAASPGAPAGSRFILRDLDSTNGTLLNGRRLAAAERLHDGDMIEIAGASFTFHDPDATLQTTHFPRLVLDEATGDVWVDRCPVQLSANQHEGRDCCGGMAGMSGRDLRLPDRKPGQAPARQAGAERRRAGVDRQRAGGGVPVDDIDVQLNLASRYAL